MIIWNTKYCLLKKKIIIKTSVILKNSRKSEKIILTSDQFPIFKRADKTF